VSERNPGPEDLVAVFGILFAVAGGLVSLAGFVVYAWRQWGWESGLVFIGIGLGIALAAFLLGVVRQRLLPWLRPRLRAWWLDARDRLAAVLDRSSQESEPGQAQKEEEAEGVSD